MQGRPIIPAPGVEASDIPTDNDVADNYGNYGTGNPLEKTVAQTGTAAWVYILGAAVVGYLLLKKPRGRRGRRK